MRKHLSDLDALVLTICLILTIVIFVGIGFCEESNTEKIAPLATSAVASLGVEREALETVTVELLPFTDEEIVLMAKVVHAEAEGESAKGKMLVAKTIMNRAEKGGWFGNTVTEVVYKPEQFDGIKRDCFKRGDYDSADIDAVLAAIDVEGYSEVAYFFNPKTATNKEFVISKLPEVVVVEGRHYFAE